MQVLVGRRRVADVELHRLADAHAVGDGQGPGLAVQGEDVAHQEVAALKIALILVDHPANVQPLLKQVLLLRRQRLPQLLQLGQRRLAAQFEDEVVLGAGDDQMPADGPAALRHDRAQPERSLQQHADRPLVLDAVLKQQAGTGRGRGCRWPCRPARARPASPR